MSEPRVFISMTTIPSRNGTLTHTLRSIAEQTTKPDAVWIYGASGVDFGDWLWSDDSNSELMRIPERISYRKLKQDPGPVAKLSALGECTIDLDDIIITIDDDIIYQPRWLETLVAGAKAHPDKAVGFCGWNASDFVRAKRDGDPSGGTYVWAPVPGPCDVLEGWAGIAYRKRHFYIDPLFGTASVLSPMEEFRHVDDVWIAWHLARRGVERATISYRMSSERPGALPGLHHREDFVDLNRRAALIAFGGG